MELGDWLMGNWLIGNWLIGDWLMGIGRLVDWLIACLPCAVLRVAGRVNGELVSG